MERIALPATLDANAALRFAAELPRTAPTTPVVIDFAALAEAEPFGLLLAGAALRAFFKTRPPGSFGADGVRNGDAAHERLAQLGFFQWLGLPVGHAPGSLDGDATWMPITILRREELETRMREALRPLGHVVQVESERFARLLTQKNEMKVNAPLAYCFREVIRNVFEHAETDRCAICAQRCRDGLVELAIVDAGRGIRSSLAEKHAIADDAAALEHALRPGVSRNLSNDPDDPWGNSGFGLYVLSELGRELGTFRLVSGTAVLAVAKTERNLNTSAFSGTAVQLCLRAPKGVNFADFIYAIVARGEAAGNIGKPVRASASTRLA